MPTYEYKCKKCGFRFDLMHGMNERYDKPCPVCGGDCKKLISAGAGVIIKGGSFDQRSARETCDQATPCCGRSERCDTPPCYEQ